MRPLRPFCGTVLKAQLLTLPATISTSANGVVTTQLSFLPPASSSATEVFGSSESRPAAAHHHEIESVRHACPPGFLLRGTSAFQGAMARPAPPTWFCDVFGVTKTS